MMDKYPRFLPQWTEAVKHVTTLNMTGKHILSLYREHHKLDWTSGECCLTGEGFFHQMADESCGYCDSATYESNRVLDNLDEFYKFKNEFAEHLQLIHPETWERWEKQL